MNCNSILNVTRTIYVYYHYIRKLKNEFSGGDKKKEIEVITLNHIYQPLRSGRIWHKVNFKWSLTGLNSEFSFS